jgi:hypothetical protein
LSATLERNRQLVSLFRDLATLRSDIPLFDSIGELRWNGPTPAFAALGARFDAAVVEPSSRFSRGRREGPGEA